MKVALPVFGSRVSPRFDFAAEVVLATLHNSRVVEKTREPFAGKNVLERVGFLLNRGVGVIICGGISGFCVRLFAQHGVRVIPFAGGDAEDVLEAFLGGGLRPRAFPSARSFGGPRFRGGRRHGSWSGRIYNHKAFHQFLKGGI